MNIQVTGRHVDISDAFKTHVEEGIKNLLDKHHMEAVEAIVRLDKQRHLFLTEVKIHLARGIHLRATETDTEAYVSFDMALDTLTGRLRRFKKRLVDHHKHHDVRFEKVPYTILNGQSTQADVDAHTETAAAVVAEMKRDIPTLSVSDAVMHFELGQEAAYIFRNVKSGDLNVLYRRSDGHIGWIDPQTSQA
jgi:ribosomal subunit interface protein